MLTEMTGIRKEADFDDGPEPPPGPYDPAPPGDAALWFLPGPETEAGAAPRDRPADRPADWAAAQAGAALGLARLAADLGALGERLHGAGPGGRARLALAEAAALSWWAGDRVAEDRLTLWEAARLAGAQADGPALQRAGWAFRRLAGGPDPRAAGPGAFLGRPGAAGAAEALDPPPGLHPVVAGLRAFAHLRAADPGQGPAGAIEAAVLAARLAGGPGLAPFLPLAAGGAAALRAGGPAPGRLAEWIAGAAAATRAALRLLEAVAAWQSRAQAGLGGLSGRTPPRLVALLAAWPMVSAPMAEARTGASRAAVQRNLARLEERGLIREITGQGRYRLWTARL